MIVKLNFHNDNELFYFDTTEQFNTTNSLKEYFNKIKVFIINDIVLSLQHYEIRELDSDFDRDVDVDVYCTKLSNVEDVQVANKQKGLFDFKGGI